MDTSLEECEKRDVKGLYRKARAGIIKGFTGIDSAYEPPENPDVILKTAECTVEDCVEQLVQFLQREVMYQLIVTRHPLHYRMYCLLLWVLKCLSCLQMILLKLLTRRKNYLSSRYQN